MARALPASVDLAPITMLTGMVCPHGGRVTATVDAPPSALTTSDDLTVIGCQSVRSPCVRVQWIDPPGRALGGRSVGICVTATNLSQGIVMFTGRDPSTLAFSSSFDRWRARRPRR